MCHFIDRVLDDSFPRAAGIALTGTVDTYCAVVYAVGFYSSTFKCYHHHFRKPQAVNLVRLLISRIRNAASSLDLRCDYSEKETLQACLQFLATI